MTIKNDIIAIERNPPKILSYAGYPLTLKVGEQASKSHLKIVCFIPLRTPPIQ